MAKLVTSGLLPAAISLQSSGISVCVTGRCIRAKSRKKLFSIKPADGMIRLWACSDGKTSIESEFYKADCCFVNCWAAAAYEALMGCRP